jgi:hypothetical protein
MMKSDGLKGLGVKEQSMTCIDPRRNGGQQGNIVDWGCQFKADPSPAARCQSAVDTKAFTGRGTRRELLQCVDRLAAIELEMKQLAQMTLDSSSICGVYLALHRRNATGYVHLRWRESGGAKRHLKADDVEQRLSRQSEQVRAWGRNATALAEQLNTAHYDAREILRAIRQQVIRRPVYLMPRAIT